MDKEALVRGLIRRLPARAQSALRTLARICLHELPFDKLLGMTTVDEQAYYTRCARSIAGKEGGIVDLGCWLCSTAISLARGIAGKKDQKVHAFDRFTWEAWMDSCLPLVSCEYHPGDCFLPEARRLIKPFAGCIELHQEDLTRYTWRQGPIKLLLVDAMKSWELARSIARSFYPFLGPGSLLIHQDFKHHYTAWILILQYRLRDYFRFQHEVVNGCTVAFEATAAIPAEAIEAAVAFDAIPDEEVEAVIQYSRDLVGPEGKAAMAAAHFTYFVHRQRLDKAREVSKAYLAAGMAPVGEFASALAFLAAAEKKVP